MCEYIGEVRVADLTVSAIEIMLSEIKKSKGYSGTSMNALFKKLKHILKDAVRKDIIVKSPADKIDAPKKSDPKRRAFDKDDFSRLIAALDQSGSTDGRVLAVRIIAATGMRPGEAMALEWRHFNESAKTITIEQSLSPTEGIKSTKTGKSRIVSIDDDTAEHLKTYRGVQQSHLKELAIEQGLVTPIVNNGIGGFIDYRNFNRWRKQWFAEHNLDYTLHELRHTHATYLFASGVDVKSLQERLGHASGVTTLDTYGHAIPEKDKVLADAMSVHIADARKKGSDEQ
jgi:integrase